MNVTEQFRAAENYPIVSLDALVGDGGLVVIAPHPDDESLGCGGLLAEASAEGRCARVIFVSDGSGSHPGSRSYPGPRLRELREEEARIAVKELGLNSDTDAVFLGLPDRRVPNGDREAERAILAIVDAVRAVRASALFVTWRNDAHCDHQASFALARQAQRRTARLSLYEYSVWGATMPGDTEISPAAGGVRLLIERSLTRKRRAIAAHKSQLTDLIDDDPNGFRLSPADLARFDHPYETFFAGP